MIRKLIQSYRRKRLLKAVIEKHGDRVYSYEHGWSSNRIFYDVRGGELIAFNSRKLCEVPVESTWLPALSEMSCFDTIPDDRRYSEFVEAVEFMKATGFPRNAGSPYFNSDRGVLYIHPASLGLDGKWVNLLTQDGASVHFPAAAFNMIYGHQRTDDHDKYLQRAAIWFDQPATPFTPVIEVIRWPKVQRTVQVTCFAPARSAMQSKSTRTTISLLTLLVWMLAVHQLSTCWCS